MRPMVRALPVMSLVIIASIVLLVAPSSGQIDLNEITISKTVVGQATAPFTVEISCEQGGSSESDGELAFDTSGAATSEGAAPSPNEQIQGDDWVYSHGTPEQDHSCTLTETDTGGANAVSFTCTATESASCSAASGSGTSVVVSLPSLESGDAVVTFTNTFEPPPVAPTAVTAAPLFTG